MRGESVSRAGLWWEEDPAEKSYWNGHLLLATVWRSSHASWGHSSWCARLRGQTTKRDFPSWESAKAWVELVVLEMELSRG